MRHREGWLGSAADGTRLFWQAWDPEGTPRAVVVLVHGAGEHGARYAYVAERLAGEGYAVYAMDHRGHGRSDGPRAMIDRLDRLVDDLGLFVTRVREEHDGRRPFVVGHSLGGAVSLTYAIRHGDTIEGLVVSGPAVATEAVPAVLKAITALMSRVAPLAPVFKIDENLISRDPAVVRAYQEDPLNHNGKLPARTLGEIMKSMDSMSTQVAGLRTPLLLLHGSDDQLCPPEGSRMVHDGAGATDKTIKVYDGLYHEIFNEPERDEVIDDLVAWLAERAERARAPEEVATR
jgi:alpha-beta hydrolase superfamily lysophospholipase